MTIKFTKTGVGAESGVETLLFEFRDEECPKELSIEYETALATNQYVGSLQTNQMQGIYLQPITWQGTFFGGCLDINNAYLTAKERADELDRLQGRVIKWWYEGIKQLVIIKKFKYTYKGYNEVDYEITLQPHDIQIAIRPSDQDVKVQESLSLISDDITKGTPNPSGLTADKLPRVVTETLNIEQKKKRILDLKDAVGGFQENLKYFKDGLSDALNKKNIFATMNEDLRQGKIAEYRSNIADVQEDLKITQEAIKEMEGSLKFNQAPKKDNPKPLILKSSQNMFFMESSRNK